MNTALTTHIEVKAVNGAGHLGIEDGQLLRVTKETKCFFFVQTHAGRDLKISKQTKRLFFWKNQSTSAVFNI